MSNDRTPAPSTSDEGGLLVLASPSGGGKSTMKERLVRDFPELRFSVSATTRAPRTGETPGRDYHFLSDGEFDRRLAAGDFLEWEAVYAGTRYGTLREEVEKILQNGYYSLLDIDVNGAERIKELYGQRALSIYIRPPSIDELRNRLRSRGTDTPEEIERRLRRASMEMEKASEFDVTVVNDSLERAYGELRDIVRQFLSGRRPR